jgi:hypothetical protein
MVDTQGGKKAYIAGLVHYQETFVAWHDYLCAHLLTVTVSSVAVADCRTLKPPASCTSSSCTSHPQVWRTSATRRHLLDQGRTDTLVMCIKPRGDGYLALEILSDDISALRGYFRR